MNPQPPSTGRESAIEAAAAALRAGRLVVLPTETVYGIAANATSPQAVAQLRKLIKAAPGQASTWHAASSGVILKALGISAPLHKRLISRLTPGPVRFVVELGEREAAQHIAALGVPPGVIESGGDVSVRVPDHPLAQAVLERMPAPVIVERASAIGLGDGRSLPADAAEKAEALGVGPVLDDGPTRLGKPSTAVRLKKDGTYEVTSVGVYDARYIDRKVERTVMFVCTGNTCRSPMAEAIAKDLIGRRPPSVPTRIVSAGVMAANGAPMTPEARAALEELGINPGHHRSRDLSPEQLADADVVFGLTKGHVDSILDFAPSAAGKVFLLDPAGSDVPDPIGGPLEEYRVTAKRLRALIEERLKELEP